MTARTIVAEGSSTTEGTVSYPNNYMVLYAARAMQNTTIHNMATGGADISTFESRQAAGIAYATRPGINILVFQGFANSLDYSPTMPTDVINRSKALLDAYKDAGFFTVATAVNPRGNANHDAKAAAINAMMAGWVGTSLDAFSNHRITGNLTYPDSAGSDTSLFYDGVHPTDLVYAEMEAALRPILNAIYRMRMIATI